MMVRIVYITLWLCLFNASLFAQAVDSLNFGPEPVGGVTKLALEYLKIDFTSSQRAILDRTTLELIYTIDSTGIATLEDVNGITDRSITDSLKRKTSTLPNFSPRHLNGRKVDAIYSMTLQYPRYRQKQLTSRELPRQYKTPRREDFEAITIGSRTDVLIGGVCNGFVGNAQKYLGIGGGMKVDVIYSGKQGVGGGLIMSFYGNRLKRDYPINTTREQDDSPVMMLVGLALNKFIVKKDRHEVLAQFEANYAVQNVSPRINNQDKDYIQFRGFSPGLSLHFLIQLGQDHVSSYYYRPTLSNHYLNFHAAVRPLFFDFKSASGVLWEIGLSYRLAYHFIESYKLKE